MILNFAFKIFLFFFYKIAIIKFFDIISLINKVDVPYIYFKNFQYSLEIILWEIFHSNNYKFISYKNYLSFYFIFKKIKLDNLLSFFYTNIIIQYYIHYYFIIIRIIMSILLIVYF